MNQVIRRPALSYQCGDWVEWVHGASVLRGRVIASVPKGKDGAEWFLKMLSVPDKAVFQPPAYRTQEAESYLVLVRGKMWGAPKVYWPLSRSLSHVDSLDFSEEAAP